MDRSPRSSIHRILVALDASPDSQAALEAAVALAAPIHAEVKGVFVQDEDLIRMAEAALTLEIRRVPARLEPSSSLVVERQLRAEARKVEQMMQSLAGRGGVAWSFQIARGNVHAYLLAASEEADLITIGRLGHSARRTQRFGSTALALMAQASCPIMILQHGARLYPDVVVLFDGSAASDRALHVAAEITRNARRPMLTVLVLGTGVDAERRKSEAEALLDTLGLHASIRSMERFSFLQIAYLRQMRREGLLVVPHLLLDDDFGDLDLLLTSRIHPILLVK